MINPIRVRTTNSQARSEAMGRGAECGEVSASISRTRATLSPARQGGQMPEEPRPQLDIDAVGGVRKDVGAQCSYNAFEPGDCRKPEHQHMEGLAGRRLSVLSVVLISRLRFPANFLIWLAELRCSIVSQLY